MNRFVLLADDDADDVEIFQEALVHASPGVTFRNVCNGVHVFNILKEPDIAAPDLIFLDLNMPQMNGWQCLTRLKSDSTYRDIPVIIYTTSAFYKDKEKAADLGAHGFITRPSNFNLLKSILEKIVSNIGADLKIVLNDLPDR